MKHRTASFLLITFHGTRRRGYSRPSIRIILSIEGCECDLFLEGDSTPSIRGFHVGVSAYGSTQSFLVLLTAVGWSQIQNNQTVLRIYFPYGLKLFITCWRSFRSTVPLRCFDCSFWKTNIPWNISALQRFWPFSNTLRSSYPSMPSFHIFYA